MGRSERMQIEKQPAEAATGCRRGFTLIEVLVVVGIIALLISILFPSLAAARRQAQAALCLSNQKQIGIGLCVYVMNNKDRFPKHSSPSSTVPRTRWPDYLHAYMKETKVYFCPTLTPRQEREFKKPFAHTVDRESGAELRSTRYHGGYGYNFQYLGNARTKMGGGALAEWALPYHARLSEIRMPGNTLAVADTRGSRKGDPGREPGEGGAAVYVIDPPLGSRDLGSRGSRSGSDPERSNMWYEDGTTPADEELFRSPPDDRHVGNVTAMFADGHAEPVLLRMLDGRTDGGSGDNRYYNGWFDASRR